MMKINFLLIAITFFWSTVYSQQTDSLKIKQKLNVLETVTIATSKIKEIKQLPVNVSVLKQNHFTTPILQVWIY